MNAGDEIRRMDEVLELLFWLQGEGLGEDATVPQMARFLTYPEAEVAVLLDRLCERGDVEKGPTDPTDGNSPARYRLSAIGKPEAGRRFKETFQELLSQGHGECNDPECDCMDDPAACRHYNHTPVQGGSGG